MLLDILAARAVTRLGLYWRNHENSDGINYTKGLLGFEPTESALKETEEYLFSADVLVEDKSTMRRLARLGELYDLDSFGYTILEFAIAFGTMPQLFSYFDKSQQSLTIERILEWAYAPYNLSDDYGYLKSVWNNIRNLFVFKDEEDIFFRQSFSLDPALIDFLYGERSLPQCLDNTAEIYISNSEALYLTLEEVNNLAVEKLGDSIVKDRESYFQLLGEDKDEMILVAKCSAALAGVDLIIVDFARLYNANKKDSSILWYLKRQAILLGQGIFISNITAESFNDACKMEFINSILKEFTKMLSPLLISTEKDLSLIPYCKSTVVTIDVKSLTRTDRIALWRYYAMIEGIKDLDCADLGSRYTLTRSQIEKAAMLIKKAGDIDAKTLRYACQGVLPPPRQGNIKKISVSYTLEQLKLPVEQKQAILDICSHVKYRHKVYDDWNMESRFAYGRNVSALFVGPPGTGKTMAVHILSGMLELPLYRIDLSQVVDKYIGETEKRLEEIFTTAEKSNVILFFDEADSVFGKRSEVNDSKDKYANTEVSYILQRIEQYDGIVILATNYRQNIDEAFMRRMRYLVEFQLPSEELRKEIWIGAFSEEVPTEGIDFNFLAKQFELSGGSIKNIVLNAVFKAAAEDKPANMSHILQSVRSENTKMGKAMIKQDFGDYSFLI